MRTRQMLGAMALLAVGAVALPAQQQQQDPQPQHEPQPQSQQTRSLIPVIGFSVGAMSIESETATQSQVGNQSWGLQLDGGVLVKRHLFFGVDLGSQFLDDKAQFQQNTTGGMKKSTAQLTYLSAMTGLRSGTLPVVPLGLGVNVGASTTITRRSIDNCTDCQTDKLKIPGGAWVEPTLFFGPRAFKLRVTDRVYFAGDGMRSVISVGGDYSGLKRH